MGLYEYSGIAVKIRAMTGRLVNKEAYEEMAALGSVTEVVDYLKRYTAYRKLFTGDFQEMHRGKAEELIRRSIFQDFQKIYLFAGMKQRKFLDIYYLKYENAILKRCLRNLFDKRGIELNLQDGADFFEKRSFLRLEELEGARTIGEFVECLKGSVFYPALKKLGEASDTTLFDYENTLNLLLVKKLFEEYKKMLTKKDLEAILEIYGSETELLNLQWIYRAKKYYHMATEDIYSFIMPIHYKLDRNTLKKMVEAKSMEELGELLKSCYYSRYSHFDMNPSSIEKVYLELIEKIRSIYIRKYPYSIACIENYLFHKETETDKLTTLVEGVRYGMGKEEIMEYIS